MSLCLLLVGVAIVFVFTFAPQAFKLHITSRRCSIQSKVGQMRVQPFICSFLSQIHNDEVPSSSPIKLSSVSPVDCAATVGFGRKFVKGIAHIERVLYQITLHVCAKATGD